MDTELREQVLTLLSTKQHALTYDEILAHMENILDKPMSLQMELTITATLEDGIRNGDIAKLFNRYMSVMPKYDKPTRLLSDAEKRARRHSRRSIEENYIGVALEKRRMRSHSPRRPIMESTLVKTPETINEETGSDLDFK